MTPTGARPAKAVTTGSQKRKARDALVDRYFELQRQIQRRMSLGMQRELREELHSLTVHQLGVLMLLRDQSVTMRELAKELDVGESAATAVVDRLVRQRLVVRHDDPADRRVVRLALSGIGESLVTKMHETACRKTADLLVALSYEQLAELVTIMETLETAYTAKERIGADGSARRGTGERERAR